MTTADATLHRQDWPLIEQQLDQEGHAVLRGVLDDALMAELASCFEGDHGLGGGDLFSRPAGLPPALIDLQRQLYQRLLPLAHRWHALLSVSHTFPPTLDELRANTRSAAGSPASALFTRLRTGDEQALHQHGGRPGAFPLQAVVLLSTPGQDFTGGEFVMTEQRPRMQSRPMVLPLRRGDVAILTVAHRPHQGSQGPYRVNLKHAISRVHSGERLGLELLFDDPTPP